MISTELFPRPETNTFPLPDAKWSKRPFTPSSGTVAVNTSGGATSAAEGAAAGAEVCVLLWHEASVNATASRNPMPVSSFISVPPAK
jgi:hypothetical protein